MATEVEEAKTLAMEMMEAVAVTEEVTEVRDQANLPPVGGAFDHAPPRQSLY